MYYRQTLASEIELSGIALHSGEQVRMRLLPAAPESGIVFRRTDVGGTEIPARLEQAGPSFYATVIQSEGHSVSTIEHLMAALYALQVDDLLIEIDGSEVPILDGSSKPFVEAILSAGRRELPVPRQYMTLVRPVEVVKDDKRISAFPCHEYEKRQARAAGEREATTCRPPIGGAGRSLSRNLQHKQISLSRMSGRPVAALIITSPGAGSSRSRETSG